MWLVAQGQRVGLGATSQRVEPQSDWLTASPHDSHCRATKEETLFLDNFRWLLQSCARQNAGLVDGLHLGSVRAGLP